MKIDQTAMSSLKINENSILECFPVNLISYKETEHFNSNEMPFF